MWVKARQESDFSLFAPVLREWVELRREKARLINPDGCGAAAVRQCSLRRGSQSAAEGRSTPARAPAVAACWRAVACRRPERASYLSILSTRSSFPPCSPSSRLLPPCSPVYDTLLDDYEPGMTSARLDEIFGQVRSAAARRACGRATQWISPASCALQLCHQHPASQQHPPHAVAHSAAATRVPASRTCTRSTHTRRRSRRGWCRCWPSCGHAARRPRVRSCHACRSRLLLAPTLPRSARAVRRGWSTLGPPASPDLYLCC